MNWEEYLNVKESESGKSGILIDFSDDCLTKLAKIAIKLLAESRQDEWVPAFDTTKMPRLNKEYLVTRLYENGDTEVLTAHVLCIIGETEVVWSVSNVIAWMPLPKPYGGKEETNE